MVYKFLEKIQVGEGGQKREVERNAQNGNNSDLPVGRGSENRGIRKKKIILSGRFEKTIPSDSPEKGILHMMESEPRHFEQNPENQ
jgi:hypothetical protein